ncbi:MAG: hypothetical protein Q8M08_10140 [Bacteroidales bacterium]|nr:hypothetical protein [Bacteroidales bacterium]
MQIIPNQANSNSLLCFTLPSSGRWTLELIDIRGAILTGWTKHMDAGNHRLHLAEILRDNELQ